MHEASVGDRMVEEEKPRLRENEGDDGAQVRQDLLLDNVILRR